MALCQSCTRDMLTADGCTVEDVYVHDAIFRRKVYGTEGTSTEGSLTLPRLTLARCRDCGSLPLKLHHPGCCVERCPKDGNQLLMCDDDLDIPGYDDEHGPVIQSVAEAVAAADRAYDDDDLFGELAAIPGPYDDSRTG